MWVAVAACPDKKVMPILNFHLVQGQHAPASIESLLLRSSKFFAEELHCPIDRVRVFVTEHAPQHVCIGGKLASQDAQPAPYFTFVLLKGRSLEDRQRLLTGFTDLVIEILECSRETVRGGINLIDPDDWGIGGLSASHLRQAEIQARQVATAQSAVNSGTL
jgi:4-oxalocrotonate tautomerase